jgi:hypothetical protein
MKPECTLMVADYTDMPIGRNELDGPKNGADFRDNYLIPALEEYTIVNVDFNGTLGTTPSFLEEVFGGNNSQTLLECSGPCGTRTDYL